MAQNFLLDSTKTWIVDEHIGKSLVITAGTGSGQSVGITSNTETVLYVTPDLDPAPDETSAYEIRYYYTSSDRGTWVTPIRDMEGWEGDLIITGGGIICAGAQGPEEIPSGGGTRFMWIPSRSALRAGWIEDEEWNETNLGMRSFAFGGRSIARGDDSIALGYDAISISPYSIAIGYNALAQGDYAYAIGSEATAAANYSLALGYSAYAYGVYSTAFRSIWVKGDYSFGINLSSETLPPEVELDNVFVIVGGCVGLGTVTPGTNTMLTVFKHPDGDQIVSIRNGTGDYQRAHWYNFPCGTDADRVGIVLMCPDTNKIGCLWNYDGDLYWKNNGLPANKSDGTKLN